MGRTYKKETMLSTRRSSSKGKGPRRPRNVKSSRVIGALRSSIEEDDSGLGDTSSFDGDSNRTPSCLSASFSQGDVDINGGHSFGNIVHNVPLGFSAGFGVTSTPQIGFVTNLNASPPKRLRLDIPEEANELPEEKCHVIAGGQVMPPILSFKNVPALLSPLKSIQTPPPVTPLPGLSIHQFVPSSCEPFTALKTEKPRKKSTRHGLDKTYFSISSDNTVQIQLLSQPEEQHRARYQTEGSRGAVKDRSGQNGQGHPVLKIHGYDRPCVVQCFVASDGGSVSPHMFYQACKVSGKNSTQCRQEKVNGTTILEIDAVPEKDMTIICDCVGILKERNVDVEQRLKSGVATGRKKSTKCRLVFRTTIQLSTGAHETIQVVSEPISCTQPPGVPEISRKSLSSCSTEGGEELFIIGKNFFKDTEVIFQEVNSRTNLPSWKEVVKPDKDFLQMTHLICVVPRYVNELLKEEVQVEILIFSCCKTSEPHPFKYIRPVKKESPVRPTEAILPTNMVSPEIVPLNNNKMVIQIGTKLDWSSKELELPQRVSSHPVNKALGTVLREQDIHPLHLTRPTTSINNMLNSTLQENSYAEKTRNSLKTITTAVTAGSPCTAALNTTQQFSGLDQHAALLSQLKECKMRKELTSCPNIHKTSEKTTENVLENLIEILKLVSTMEVGSLQPTFVQLIAEEILNQVKTESGPAGETRSSAQDTGQHTQGKQLRHQSSNVIGEQEQSSILSIREQAGVPFSTLTDKSSRVDHVNVSLPSINFITPCNNQQLVSSSIQNQLGVASRQQKFVFTSPGNVPGSVISSEQNSDTLFEALNQPVILNVDFLPNGDVSSKINTNKSINLLPVNVSQLPSKQDHTINLLPVNVSQLPSKQDHTIIARLESTSGQPNYANVKNELEFSEPFYTVLTEQFAGTRSKENCMKPTNTATLNTSDVNSNATTSFPSLQTRIEYRPIPLVTQTSPQTCMTINNIRSSCGLLETASNVLPNTSSQSAVMSNPTTNTAVLMEPLPLHQTIPEAKSLNLQEDRLHVINSNSILTNPSNNNQSYASSTLQSEDRDPLLSQASSSAQIFHPEVSQASTILGNQTSLRSSMNSAISSEAAKSIAQLSETELLNYINPNCFDNL